MIPADLLNQLREKDPELWERYSQWQQHENIRDERALQYILQGELQDAIRARGWGLGFGVTWGCPSAVISINLGKPFIREKGGTEAEALCKAYLAALEAGER